jgi:uncharacterized protein
MRPRIERPARARRVAPLAAGAVLLALLAAIDLAAIDPVGARVALPPSGGRSVHDLAGVISPDAVSLMEHRHQELFEKTGVAIAIVTVPELDGEPIEDFAVRAGSEWGAGRKGEDRGIVVALAIAERRVFIATGYGVEGFLPDGRIGGILDAEVIPPLKRNDFSTAMFNASQALVRAAAAEYGVSVEGVGAVDPRAGAGRRGADLGPGATFLLVLLALIALVVIIRHPWLLWLFFQGSGRRGGGMRWGSGGGFGGNSGFGGFGGGGFGGGGAGRGF